MYEMIREGSCHNSVSGMCEALGVCRAEYYRWRTGVEMIDVDKDMELRDRIQSIALEWIVYGYRRIRAELRRQGIVVNDKRVLRVMREDNLLCLRKKSFIKTTDSSHIATGFTRIWQGV